MSSARRARMTVQTSLRTSTLMDEGSRLAVLMSPAEVVEVLQGGEAQREAGVPR